MKKNYKRNWLFKFKSAFTLSFILFSGIAMAQLNGNFTINSASPTGGTNYQSFGAFATDINTNGVSGPVVVDVVANSGPYNEKVTFTASGTATNTITINGNGETIENNFQTVIHLKGADYFTIDNLNVKATGTGSGTRCYTLNGGANNNTIKNSNLTLTKYTSTSSSTAYIAFSASLSSRSAGNHGSNNVIDNNTMSSGSSTSPSSYGPYYGILDYRSSSTRGVGNIVTNNTIKDVRYAGLYSYYVDGFQFNKNSVNFKSSSTSVYAVYALGSNPSTLQVQVNDNTFENIDVSSLFYGIYFSRVDGTADMPAQQNRNTFNDIITGSSAYCVRSYYCDFVEILDNHISNYNAGSYMYGPYIYDGATISVENNMIHDNVGSNGFYGAYFYGCDADSKLNNNLIYNNSGKWFRGLYTGTNSLGSSNVSVTHNTIICNKNTSEYIRALYLQHSSTIIPSNFNIKNNIITITGVSGRGSEHYGIYARYHANKMNWASNVFYTDQPVRYYANSATPFTTWDDWVAKSGDNTSVFADPKFADIANGNLKPTNPAISNIGAPNISDLDIDGVTRTTCGPDPGVYEFFVDHSISNLGFLPTSICGGQTNEISFDVTNGTSSILEGLTVFYDINGNRTTEKVTSIGANATLNFTFTQSPEFNAIGTNQIEVGLLCDDDLSNNSLTHTLDVIASPSGGTLSQGAIYDGYFEAGTELSPDAIAAPYTNEYVISRPAKYTSTAPGVDYTYSLNATDIGDGSDVTTNGFLYAGGESFSIDPDANLAGKTILVELLVSDANTGCDSTMSRYVYIPHVPVPSFNSDDYCLGDVAQFKNTSTLEGSGYIVTNWEFDDPDPSVTDDNSDIKDGFWKYTTYGNNVNVKMTVSNGLYPKFIYSKTNTIDVKPKPIIDFKVLNACEGSPIKVNNNTTLPVNSPITYEWDFAGEYTTTDIDPSYTFGTPGQRKISVTATSNGCFASLTKNAYQFEMPTASFSSEGECNFVNVDFTNGSTIENGVNMGYAWDFDGEGISREENPSFAFATPGTKNVTLTATSEFGCVNKFTKDILLKESPEADFAWDAACNLTPINFSITGSLPNGGANSSYEWDFAGEADATRADPSHLFSKVGPKMVKLTISDLNGCSSSIEKEVNVVLQAVADFEVGTSICSDDEVAFTNKSTVAAGDLTYEWTFGDGATSSDLSPTHLYTEAKSYNVKLKAIVEGGCSDEVTYPIVVNPSPDATFTLAKDGRTVVCDGPAGNDIYRWTFGDGSRDDAENPTYTYENVDQGTFTVCLATKKGECWNDECEDITINLAGIEDLTQNNDMINVYPNPTTGMFNVTVENAGEVVVKVGDILGNVLDVNVTDNMNGTYSVDLSVVADGVYFVQVKNGDYFATKRITVSK